MIVPDVNLPVFAYNASAPYHERARAWWEASLSSARPVGLAWVVILGYLRLTTSRTVLVDPFLPAEAIGHVRSWLGRPNVVLVGPGPRHLDLVKELMRGDRAPGQVTTGVPLAAIALEHRAELCSSDTGRLGSRPRHVSWPGGRHRRVSLERPHRGRADRCRGGAGRPDAGALRRGLRANRDDHGSGAPLGGAARFRLTRASACQDVADGLGDGLTTGSKRSDVMSWSSSARSASEVPGT